MTGTKEITNTEDILYSLEIEERIDYLEDAEDAEDTDDIEERKALEALREQCLDNTDEEWKNGVTLIRDTYFEAYAEELADDIGAIDKDASWPVTYIDWEAAAEALQQDYLQVEFDGVTYWAR